jgi:hypothetical protein
MSDLPRAHLAVRQTRKLLINVGLREDEADAFLDRLSQEFAAGRLADETTQLEFIRRELAEIRQEQRKTPGRLENAITGIVTGLVTGVGSSALYEALKTSFSADKPAAVQPTEEDWEHVVQVDWAGGRLLPLRPEEEQPLLHALTRQQQRKGTLDATLAVILDGIGMYLDARGNHGKAIRQRLQAAKISKRVNGPAHESTGAALSNLGLSFFLRREFAKSDIYLVEGLKILLGCVGDQHHATAGAAYNLYYCVNAQARFPRTAFSPETLQSLGRLRAAADQMMARKKVIVNLVAAKVALVGLQEFLAQNA